MLEPVAPSLTHSGFRLRRLEKQSLSSPRPLGMVCQLEEFSGFPEALGPRSALAPTTEMWLWGEKKLIPSAPAPRLSP